MYVVKLKQGYHETELRYDTADTIRTLIESLRLGRPENVELEIVIKFEEGEKKWESEF